MGSLHGIGGAYSSDKQFSRSWIEKIISIWRGIAWKRVTVTLPSQHPQVLLEEHAVPGFGASRPLGTGPW